MPKIYSFMFNLTENNQFFLSNSPSVMGRKNYLFSHDDKGAEDNAVFYSLLESCDVVQLNPLDWLTDVLDKLKDNMDEDYTTNAIPIQKIPRITRDFLFDYRTA